MNLDQAIAAFIQHRHLRHRSLQTIDQYQYQIERLWAHWRQINQHPEDITLITLDELANYFTYLEHEHINQKTGRTGLGAATIDSAWRVLRTFWNFAARRKWLLPEQIDFFQDDEVIARPAIDERMRPVLEDDVLEALINACRLFGDPEERARNRAILIILSETGMRVGEIAGMRDKDLRIKEYCAKIIGKGNREEWVFWRNRGDRALRAYLQIRPEPLPDDDIDEKHTGYVFRRLTQDQRMTPDAIRKIIKTIAAMAQVELPAGAPAHSFRHRFAHKGIDAGLDISQVSQLMRHRNTHTTQRYLRENKARLRKIRDKMKDKDDEE